MKILTSEIVNEYAEIKGIHEATNAMPMASNEDYKNLVEDISKNGLAVPLVIDQNGLLLDGRNRLLACYEIGIKPNFEYISCEDSWAYVWSLNGARRHLTKSQCAMYGADWIAHKVEAEAKERQRAAIKERDEKGRATSTCATSGTSGKQPAPKSRDIIGKKVGVGHSYIDAAKKIKTKNPKIANDVRQGKINIKRAIKEMEKPKTVDRKSWVEIAHSVGVISVQPNHKERTQLQKRILEIDSDIKFEMQGANPETALRIENACKIILEENKNSSKINSAKTVANKLKQNLSLTAQQKYESALRAGKRVLELEMEERVKIELDKQLPFYVALSEKHKKVVDAYKGPLSHKEYKMILGCLHPDKLTGLDDIQKTRYNKAFNILKEKEFELAGLPPREPKRENTLARNSAELRARRKNK